MFLNEPAICQENFGQTVGDDNYVKPVENNKLNNILLYLCVFFIFGGILYILSTHELITFSNILTFCLDSLKNVQKANISIFCNQGVHIVVPFNCPQIWCKVAWSSIYFKDLPLKSFTLEDIQNFSTVDFILWKMLFRNILESLK